MTYFRRFIILVVIGLVTSAASLAQVTVELDDVRALVGQTVQVPLRLSGVEKGTPVQAFQVTFGFSSDAIKLVDYSFEDVLVDKDGWNTRCLLASTNYCDGFSSTPNAFSSSGVLVYLHFEMEGTVDHETISLLDFRLNGGIPNHIPGVPSLSFTSVSQPIAVSDTYEIAPRGTTKVSAENGVLSNDKGTGPLTVQLVSKPAFGEVILHSDGSFDYTTDTIEKEISFTYLALDGHAMSNEVRVTLHVE